MQINFYKKYEEKYIFEGEQREKYRQSILKWLIVSCFSVFFPLLITLITDCYDGAFNFIDLINNGDLILLSFSLTIPTALDLLESQSRSNDKDHSLSLCRYICLFIVAVQVLFYALIRTHDAKFITNLISTCVIVPVSIYVCRYSIFCMFINSVKEEG